MLDMIYQKTPISQNLNKYPDTALMILFSKRMIIDTIKLRIRQIKMD